MGALRPITENYVLRTFGSKIPMVFFLDKRHMRNVYNVMNWVTTAVGVVASFVALLILVRAFSLTQGLRIALAHTYFWTCLLVLALYFSSAIVFHRGKHNISPRYIIETNSSFIASSVMLLYAACMVVGVANRYDRDGLHFDDDDEWPVEKREGKIVEAVALGFVALNGLLAFYWGTIRSGVAHMYPETAMNAESYLQETGSDLGIHKDPVPTRTFLNHRIALQKPTISYYDPTMVFWNSYNILNISIMAFANIVAFVDLLFLLRIIPLNEDVRHVFSIGYAAFGILLSVLYIVFGIQFYHEHPDVTHRYRIETIVTLISAFAFFSVSFAMMLVVDNQYGRNGIVPDDEDIHFDDDDVWNLPKQEGKVIEAIVFAYQIFMSVFVTYHSVRAIIQHLFAEVNNQVRDYIEYQKRRLLRETKSSPGVRPAPVGLLSFRPIKNSS